MKWRKIETYLKSTVTCELTCVNSFCVLCFQECIILNYQKYEIFFSIFSDSQDFFKVSKYILIAVHLKSNLKRHVLRPYWKTTCSAK